MAVMSRGGQIVQGGGRSSITTTLETRWYANEIAPNNYLGSTYSWTQYSRNTCGTVIPYPESDFILLEKFAYKDSARSLRKVFKGKVVIVAIGIRSTANLSDAARTRAMKNLVESGGNFKDNTGVQIRQPPLNRIIRKRFGFASMKTVYMRQGVMFLLFDCDESKDDEKVKIIQLQQS